MDNYIFLSYNPFSLSSIAYIFKDNVKIDTYIFPELRFEELNEKLNYISEKYQIKTILLHCDNDIYEDMIKKFNSDFDLRIVKEGDIV